MSHVLQTNRSFAFNECKCLRQQSNEKTLWDFDCLLVSGTIGVVRELGFPAMERAFVGLKYFFGAERQTL
jgi:hypothetical protein